MRYLAIAFSAMFVSVSAAHAKQATHGAAPVVLALPIFDFLGQNTENPSSPFALSNSPCNPTAIGKTICDNNLDTTKIGDAPVVSLIMAFNNGKLYGVKGDTIKSVFPNLLAAFTAKYGAPAARETRKWQNQAGSVFDNPTVIWKFRGGNLELSQMGMRQDGCAFVFNSSENAPKDAPPPINF